MFPFKYTAGQYRLNRFGLNTIYGRRPNKIDLKSRNLILRKMHFYKKKRKN